MKRSGEQSDFVASRRQQRDRNLPGASESYPVSRDREPAQRVCDGPRKKSRQQDRKQERSGKDKDQGEALRPDDAADVPGVDRQQENPVVGAGDRDRGGNVG